METKVGIFIFVFFLNYDTIFTKWKWEWDHVMAKKQGKSNGGMPMEVRMRLNPIIY